MRSFQIKVGMTALLALASGWWVLLESKTTIMSLHTTSSKDDHDDFTKRMRATLLPSTRRDDTDMDGEDDLMFTLNNKKLLDTKYMIKIAKEGRATILRQLKIDYGEQPFQDMWTMMNQSSLSRGLNFITSADVENDPSTPKFRRKLQMKLLEVQSKILDKKNGPNKPVSFVWSSGGNSVSAGHGNMFNESSNSIMLQNMRPIFSALGIDFIGRNYGMSNAQSAPELALCNEQVYGLDADVIAWDFGVTDGKHVWMGRLFSSRTGMHANHPIHISLNVGGSYYQHRLSQLKATEKEGAPVLHLVPDQLQGILDACPDSFGLSQAELDMIGPSARMFKCKGNFEKHDCGRTGVKYSIYKTPNCSKRSGMALWHPGWKWNALIGNVLTLFLVESLVAALEELLEKDYGDQSPAKILAQMKAQEDLEYQQFYNTFVNKTESRFINITTVESGGLKVNSLYRNRAICRTPLVPAQSRYLGIMSNLNTVEEAIAQHAMNQSDNMSDNTYNNTMTLCAGPSVHRQCQGFFDKNDFFYINENYGWVSTEVPNDSEIATYFPDGSFHQKKDGIVMLCPHACMKSRCPEGTVGLNGLRKGEWQMEVNGDPVVDIASAGNKCVFVKTKEFGFHNKPNKDGRFVLRLKVHTNKNSTIIRSLRMGSIIVV